MESLLKQVVAVLSLSTILLISGVRAWTGEIHGRVVCDVCGDSSIGPEDHVLEVDCNALECIRLWKQAGCLWNIFAWGDMGFGTGGELLEGVGGGSWGGEAGKRGGAIGWFQYAGNEYGTTLSLGSAEVAVLCITTSGEVLNYQAYTNSKGMYTVAETMPESDRWDACLARPISSFHEHCTHLGGSSSGVKFTYSRPSGYFHTVRPFVYQPTNVPTYF
ncbi:hypothetical protein RHMOL_Rhmol04G0023200 [Rhododendron molle]|uniref:Uncharacterized protein n=1 Tax=Rhododendron molle TaxID=49168 RepID=A0ACC0NXB7_RHOML|nr:hypothetical protein RHMOL_Rhmol04G0023200 [Rhododendron molle]